MPVIYTVTPSWLLEKKSEFAAGIRTLQGLGFTVKNTAWRTRLPTPQAKARELQRACADSSVDIVLARRGGASSMQLLPHLDFAALKKHPKLFAGFSDFSTLLNTVYERTGMVTLHAPMVLNLSAPTPFTVTSFMNALQGFPRTELFAGAPVRVFVPGRATGTLKGGNLVTLTTLIGTPWETVTENAVVFLEDVDEKLHEIDRYLTQWILAGKFRHVRGLILGDFRGTTARDVFRIIARQMTVSFPVVHCPYIGHVPDKITLPVGGQVVLDTCRRALTLQ